MNAEEMFRKSGAILDGHFVLTSGRHSPVYWEKFRVMQYPEYVRQLCGMIAAHYKNESIDLVAGPTTAGIILAFEVARQMARLDLETLPVPDCLVFLDLEYSTWRRLLQTSTHHAEDELRTHDVFRMQEYMRSGVEFVRKHFGVKTITVRAEFGSPKETAEKVKASLCDVVGRSLDNLVR